MLDFMYGSSYEPAEANSNDALFHSTLANVKAKESLGTDFGMNQTVASLFIHLEMNSIADFYDIYQLREIAIQEINGILTICWTEVNDWYPAFLEATFKKTTDVTLHSMLVNITSSHLGELSGSVYGRNVNLDIPVWFLSALLEKIQEWVNKKRQDYGDMLEKIWQPQNCHRCSEHTGYTFETIRFFKPTSALIITRNLRGIILHRLSRDAVALV